MPRWASCVEPARRARSRRLPSRRASSRKGPLRAYRLMVSTLSGDRVVAITGFPDTSVFASFGLPRMLST
jgi:hypothetical protein